MRAGCATTVITPPLGTPLAGFGSRREGARGVHDDLYARALVLEESGERIALVACDLCETDVPFVAEIRRRASASADLSPDRIMVAATHTHAAPATFALYCPPPDPEWLRALAGRISEAIETACLDLEPAALGLGLGREETVARNRRRPDGPVDPTVTVLRADRQRARPVLLAHYACHPTVLGPDNLMVSRDYTGFLVDALEQAAGGCAVFANGAAGDINVGHSADRSALGLPIPGRTFERAEELGLRVAREAARAYSGAHPLAARGGSGGPSLAAGVRRLLVPLRPTPTAREADVRVRDLERCLDELQHGSAAEEELSEARLELMYAEMARDWARRRGEAVEEEVEVQVLAAGGLAIVALPGEFFAESGMRLRERSPFAHTIAVGYANGGVGYVPPAAAFAEGGYETRLTSWSRVAPEAEALIVDTAVDLLEKLWQEGRA